MRPISYVACQQEQQLSPFPPQEWPLPQQQNNKRRITISQMQEQLLSKPIFVTSLVLLCAIVCPCAAVGILYGEK